MYGYIYVIINKKTKQYYIGQHKGEFDEKYWGSPGDANKIKYDFDELGEKNFIRHVLSYENSAKELALAEEKFIGDKYKTDILCYNVSPGGNKTVQHMSEIGKIGAEKSRDIIKAIVENRRKQKIKEYEKNPKFCSICSSKLEFEYSYRKTCSKECFQSLVSMNNSKRVMSEETKKKISKSLSKDKETFFCSSCGKELQAKRKTGKCKKCLLFSRWSEEDIKEICEMKDDGMTYQQIAEEFSVTHPTIVKVYKTYKYGIKL